jgi:uncharacterized membrane protein YjgN (DUF898 family)
MNMNVPPPAPPPLPPIVPSPPMASVPSVPPEPPPAIPANVVFAGRRPDFRRLVMRGALLELITVGFYRFWLATDMRRHLWSNTSVGGDAPEYTGTAKELFIGFLFAMAILVPIYLAYFLLGIEAERYKEWASTPLFLFFYLFLQFAVYRARRYRLTRTVWRGVRFNMGGSGWNFAWRAGLWSLVTSFTFGIALPWRQASLERYKMRHTGYGNLAARFEGTGGQLFKQVWWIWLLMWPSFFLMIPLPFLYGAYKAIEWRWWISGIGFGKVRFESTMSGSDIFDLYWKVIGWSTLISTILMTWVGAAIGIPLATSSVNWSQNDGEKTALEAFNVILQPSVLGVAAAGYLVCALAFVVVLRIYLVRDVWQRVADTTRIHNIEAAENVTARGNMVGALGEGFADSLDVAGF